MRTIFLNLLAVVVTFVAFQSQGIEEHFNFSEEKSLTALEMWDLPIFKEEGRNKLKTSYLAQDFIPIVTIAFSTIERIYFDFYSHIYQLTRRKIFFLII